jgi:hypothetical protein
VASFAGGDFTVGGGDRAPPRSVIGVGDAAFEPLIIEPTVVIRSSVLGMKTVRKNPVPTRSDYLFFGSFSFTSGTFRFRDENG